MPAVAAGTHGSSSPQRILPAGRATVTFVADGSSAPWIIDWTSGGDPKVLVRRPLQIATGGGGEGP